MGTNLASAGAGEQWFWRKGPTATPAVGRMVEIWRGDGLRDGGFPAVAVHRLSGEGGEW